ncbi:MAG: extracellular solute-binding protein [Rhodocyclaceae bacterium]
MFKLNSLARQLVAASFVAAGSVASLMGSVAHAQTPPPSKPVVINVVDVGGALAFLQEGMEKYRDKNPKVVSRITFTKAPAPELPGKLKAMQAANRSDIDLVVGGVDILSSGIDQSLWIPIFPTFAKDFPSVLDSYLPAAAKMQELAQNQALAVGFMYNGPFLEYNPATVKTVPSTPQELLAWCKANPNKFIYARPANSGPGRAFIMGLPYMLGDRDPKDPVKGWDKTWAYLKDLDSCIEYYPSGTGAVFKEVGEGSRDITVTTTGWDINPRALGIVPKEFKINIFKGMTFVNDSQYMMVPKGVTGDKLAAVIDLMRYMMQPEAQALTWDKGYFYPGPAIKNVPLSMAPKASQDVMKEFGRPEYDEIMSKYPQAQQLDAKALVAAFRKWDEDIGARKTR